MDLINFIFRATDVLIENGEIDPVVAGGIMAIIMGMIVVFLVIALVGYVISSLVFMKIGKKVGYPSPGLAWIPAVGPALISSKIAQMHWWPILLLVGVVIPYIGAVFSLAFGIFMLVWIWKVFEAFGKPGWMAILFIIPLINLVPLIMLLIIAFGSSTYSGPKIQGQTVSDPKSSAK